MRKFELFFKGPITKTWVSWAIVPEDYLEIYLDRWQANTKDLNFGKLKCREILGFGDGPYTRERMRDLSGWLREKS